MTEELLSVTHARPQPVYAVSAAMLSALGSDPVRTLAALASPDDRSECLSPADVRVPDEDLEEALAAVRAAEVPAQDCTRSLTLAAAGALPLLRAARAAGFRPEDIGFVLGSTAAGTAESAEQLRAGQEDPVRRWMPIEIGRTAAWIAKIAGIAGPAYAVSTACTAGLKAILDGARMLLTGRAEAVVAGGIDPLSPLTAAGFSALGARSPGRSRPFDLLRSGMHIGEGGGFLLLTRDPQRFPELPAERLTGWGETSDAHHICAPHPEGAGAAAAIGLALAGRRPDFVLLHGTGTQHNDRMEALAMLHACPNVPCASMKRLIGHQLAGAGAFSAAAAWAILAGLGPLPLNFSFSGCPDPDLPEAFLRCLTGPSNAKDLPMPRSILAAAYAFGGSNAALLLEKETAND